MEVKYTVFDATWSEGLLFSVK